MNADTIRKDRIILNFPAPFSQDLTPYGEVNFSETVKKSCSSHPHRTSHLKLCKVIILGDLGVGKTSMVNRFCHQTYNYNYKATIGVDFEFERFNILNVPFNMQIWDTAGQERFRSIAGAYYRSAHAIVTVFDLGSGRSLRHCPVWLKEAMECNIDEPLKFLVGTKRDLLMDTIYEKMEKEAGETARFLGAEYWAISSKTGSNVAELFYRIAALCFEHILKLEIDSPEQRSQIKLGRNLIDPKERNEHCRKELSCETGIKRCMP